MKDVVDMSQVPLPLCPIPILNRRLILLLVPLLFVGLLVLISRPPDWYGLFSLVSLVATLCTIYIPSCYKQAMEHECWQNAKQTKLQALEENHTWDIVPCPPTVKPIRSKWVFSVKLHFDGSLDRYKARLVALDNKQEYEVDYEETFAPIAKMTTVRTILAITTSHGWTASDGCEEYFSSW